MEKAAENSSRPASIHRLKFGASDKLAVTFCLAAIAFLVTGNLVHINRIRLHVSPLKLIKPASLSYRGPIMVTGSALQCIYTFRFAEKLRMQKVEGSV
jgi:hypothetical protein